MSNIQSIIAKNKWKNLSEEEKQKRIAILKAGKIKKKEGQNTI